MKCGSRSCSEDAVARVYWPGQPLVMCRACGLRATGLANTLGFTLSVEPLEEVRVTISQAQMFGL